MSEIDRGGDSTADDFGVKRVAPLREVDMIRIIRRLEPLLERGVSFYQPENRSEKPLKLIIYSSMVLKPFGIIIHSGCLNICSPREYDNLLYSVTLEMDGDVMSTATISIVAAILHKKGFTHFHVMD